MKIICIKCKREGLWRSNPCGKCQDIMRRMEANRSPFKGLRLQHRAKIAVSYGK